jgi:hypothetical protein
MTRLNLKSVLYSRRFGKRGDLFAQALVNARTCSASR